MLCGYVLSRKNYRTNRPVASIGTELIKGGRFGTIVTRTEKVSFVLASHMVAFIGLSRSEYQIIR